MNTKIDITKKVLEIVSPGYTEKDLRVSYRQWWVNVRKNSKGGFRLTPEGFAAFSSAKIESYKIRFFDNPPPDISINQMILWVDRYMDCPFFISPKELFVFGSNTAIQLILFSGDMEKFIKTKAYHAKHAT